MTRNEFLQEDGHGYDDDPEYLANLYRENIINQAVIELINGYLDSIQADAEYEQADAEYDVRPDGFRLTADDWAAVFEKAAKKMRSET